MEPLEGSSTQKLGGMKPYYQDDYVTLYQGDALEIAPRLDVEAAAVVTDPPYGETSLEWDRWPKGWPKVAMSLAPVLWCFGSFRMFRDQHSELVDWKLAQEIVWEKHNGSGFQDDRFKRVHELAVQFYRGEWESIFKAPVYTPDATKRTLRRKERPPHLGVIEGSTYTAQDGGPRMMRSVIPVRSCHGYATNETQKPEGIIWPLLEFSVPPGGLVVDLFAGSGTTLSVARQQGKRAIGIEKRISQCEDIVKRLSQQVINLESPTTELSARR